MLPRRSRLLKLIALGWLVVLGVALAATPQVRTASHTLLLVPQLLPAIPVKPQQWFAGEPTRRPVVYASGDSEENADLYVPAGGGRHGAVLLFLGVNPAGKDDERVVNLANGLARAGLVVMIPWSDRMTQKRVHVEEVENLVAAFRHMQTLKEDDPNRLGMGGFCVGASLAAVAAQDDRIRDEVQFVNFFGGYYDARDLVKSVVTESRFYGDDSEAWEPNRLSVEVVTSHLVEAVPDPDERALLSARFEGGSTDAVVDGEALSPEARVVWALLSGPTLDEAEGLLAQLPERTLAHLAAISPSEGIDRLSARTLIMHDRQDELVPSEESRRMAEAMRAGGDVYYTEFSFFRHVDPTRSASPAVFAREAFKLYLHLYNVLREAR